MVDVVLDPCREPDLVPPSDDGLNGVVGRMPADLERDLISPCDFSCP